MSFFFTWTLDRQDALIMDRFERACVLVSPRARGNHLLKSTNVASANIAADNTLKSAYSGPNTYRCRIKKGYPACLASPLNKILNSSYCLCAVIIIISDNNNNKIE